MKICLMYHDVFRKIPEESGLASDLYKITVEEFESQIVKICNYNKKNPNNVLLTFDDGGSSFYDPISQILDKYKLKGYFFIATQFIDSKGFLTRNQIEGIDKRGHIIGSHSHSHPDNLSSMSEEDVKKEWSTSIAILEEICGHTINYASIPNGYQSKKVLEMANSAKINTLFTSKPTCEEYTYKNMIVLGRFVILKGMSCEEIMTIIESSRKRRILWLKWFVLDIIKHLFGTKYETIKQKVLGEWKMVHQ